MIYPTNSTKGATMNLINDLPPNTTLTEAFHYLNALGLRVKWVRR